MDYTEWYHLIDSIRSSSGSYSSIPSSGSSSCSRFRFALQLVSFAGAEGSGEPRMEEDVASFQPLSRIASEQISDEAARSGRNEIGNDVVAADDFSEEAKGSGILEGIASH